MLLSRRNGVLLAALVAAAIAFLWLRGGEAPVEPESASRADDSTRVARNRPVASLDPASRPDTMRQPGPRPSLPTRRGNRLTPVTATKRDAIPRPSRVGSRTQTVLSQGAIRRAPADVDTSRLMRPIGEKLEGQSIPKEYAAYADRAYALYEARKYQEARRFGLKLLTPMKDNISMRRLVVASSCHLREPDVAREHIGSLPDYDAKQMRELCAKAGVPLP